MPASRVRLSPGVEALSRLLHAVSDALGIPMEDLVGRATQDRTQQDADSSAVERAIRQEPRLSTTQKEALISVFKGFLEAGIDTDGSS